MYVREFLHKMLSSVMHKKRLETLSLLVKATLRNKRLSLTELGREIDLPIQERSGIRRVDRFLGNKKLHKEREMIYKTHIKNLIGSKFHPDIIVDWSNIPNTTNHTLRAALSLKGRAITLYDEVHPENQLENKNVQNRFLYRLKALFPEQCCPIIITDGGFHNDWFREIVKLGWDYLGRIRAGSGKKYSQEANVEWKTCASLMKKATSIPKYLGKVLLCKHNPMNSYLYIFKGKSKGRTELNRYGERRFGPNSFKYREAANEPWLLATSLHKGYCMPKKVVKKYSTRMQIEEGFRDLKSSRYGFGFENAHSKKVGRIEILLLIATIASYIAWLIGWLAEKNGLHYQFQSNSVKTRKILSYFFLGCRIVKKKIIITLGMLQTAMEEVSCYVL